MTDSRRQEIERLVWIYGDAVHFYGNQGDKVVAAMDAVSSAIDALLKDAERYRWLRAQADGPNPILPRQYEANSGDELDAAIDAALSPAEGEKT
jgi:hypothetical protein